MSTTSEKISQKCPFCGSTAIVTGSLTYGGDDPNFHLHEMKGFTWKFWLWHLPRLPFARKAAACAQCGKVWSQMDVAQLRKNVQAYGTDELKRRILTGHDDT